LTIAVSSVYTGARPRPQVIIAAFVVTCGFLIGTAPSFYRRTASTLSQESAIALFYGCMSSLVLSIHAVLKKTALGHVGQSVITLAYFGNLFMAAALVPCIVFHGELGIIHQRLQNVDEDWTTFAVGSIVTGVFGFLLGISHSLSIKASSLN
jgi:GDP-fucose transporter C1